VGHLHVPVSGRQQPRRRQLREDLRDGGVALDVELFDGDTPANDAFGFARPRQSQEDRPSDLLLPRVQPGVR
jgi:hypothetical protein